MAAERPKICYILPRYDLATGSHFFHLYELISRAAEYLDINLVIEKAIGGQPSLRVPFRVQSFSWPPFRFLELVLLLVRERLRGCRNFYTHYSFYGGVASWVVTRIFGGRAFYWNCGIPWLYRRSWLEERVFRFVLRHLILVTGTPKIAERYREKYRLQRDRIRILSNWVNAERFRNAPSREEARRRLGIAPEAKAVLFVHRLSRRKGAHLIPDIAGEVIRLRLNASADSAKPRRDVIFLVVGTGPEEESLKLKVKSLKLAPDVRMVGEVPHRELPAYYRAADVFLMPSEEEGFPHVLLEAMASGLPHVASDVGGVREITPQELHEYLVPSGDTVEFARKLLDLLTMPSHQRERLAQREQEWAKRYDLGAILLQFTGLFES